MKLLIEGPVGHMNHPFDLESVKNGQDLLDVFKNQIIQYINKPDSFLSIKIDGINGPIRFIRDEGGNGQFAIDRLSTAPLDLKGVTVDDLRNRFERVNLDLVGTDLEIKPQPIHKLIAKGIRPEQLEPGQVFPIKFKGKMRTAKVLGTTTGHGFVNDGGIALEVLNNAYRKRTKEIESLLDIFGMLNDPNVCLNNDIVHESSKETGKVNVINYDKDFIALHGLNRIYVEEGKKARKTREIIMSPEQKKALEEFVDICNETNTIEGFSVVSPFDLRAQKTESKVDYTEILKVPITLYKDPETPITKTMEQWLQDPNILKPKYGNVYQFADGKKRDAFSKDVYVSLIPPSGDALSVEQILDPSTEIDDKVFYDFASGAIFYHATRLLGNEVLKTLVNTTDIGGKQITDHEGIVMRDADLFGTDDEGNATIVKVTGDFILSGMRGGISQAMSKEKDQKPIQEKISIRISKDKEIIKTSMDWLKEISKAKVKYIKLDEELYNDIITGKPIVELVPQSIAENTIYSAVIDQLNVLCEEDEEFEPEEIEKQTEIEPETIAIIPGSFKPPHRGHLEMLEGYLQKADKAIVLISVPTAGGRSVRGIPGGRSMTSQDSIDIWEKMTSHIDPERLEIKKSSLASPIEATYNELGTNTTLPEGTRIILGASTKGGDISRFSQAENYVNDSLELLNIQENAFEPVKHADWYLELLGESGLTDLISSSKKRKSKLSNWEKRKQSAIRRGKTPPSMPKDVPDSSDFHASDARELIALSAEHKAAQKLLEDFFGNAENVKFVLNKFGVDTNNSLEELSSAGGSGMPGEVGDVEGAPDKDDEIIRREQKTNNNVTVDEIMRLIMERGILQ